MRACGRGMATARESSLVAVRCEGAAEAAEPRPFPGCRPGVPVACSLPVARPAGHAVLSPPRPRLALSSRAKREESQGEELAAVGGKEGRRLWTHSRIGQVFALSKD